MGHPPAADTPRKTPRVQGTLSRRSLLKVAAGAGACLFAPSIIRPASAAGGTVSALIWTGYVTPDFLKDFKRATGITVNITAMGSNEEMISQLTATRGRAWDIIAPSAHRRSQIQSLNLTQPWDLAKITNLHRVEDRYLQLSGAWTWGGGQHHLPLVWGTEGIAWRTDMFQTEYGKLSFADLWRPDMKGRVQGRAQSLMAGIGRLLAAEGKVPPFEDSYKDEGAMRKSWSAITAFAVKHKAWVRAFWNDHESQKTNFLRNGVVIGQTWDGPALELARSGQPIAYMAPKEGAFAWLDGLSLTAAARNVDAAHAFVNALYSVKAGAQTTNRYAYNSVVKDVASHLDAKARAAFALAYPGDALQKLWWWPDEPVWYARVRDDFRDRFLAA